MEIGAEIPENKRKEINKDLKKILENNDLTANNQVYSIVTGKDPSWQGIIYNLINSEQLDPWNIDLSKLCNSYFEKIKELEEEDFFISSKILLAASLLLRIKSEFLLNKHIKEIDDVLFQRTEEKKYTLERIEFDEELPVLLPKTPIPRFKKVTLQDLISALDKAMKVESRKINKEIQKKQAERLSYVDIPKIKRVNIGDRIRIFYAQLLTKFKNKEKKGELIKLHYSEITGTDKEQRISSFLPLLHLSNRSKIWLEQEKHFDEIEIYLYEEFKKYNPEYYKEIRDYELEEIEESDNPEIKKQENVQKINKDFENPLADLIEDSKEVE